MRMTVMVYTQPGCGSCRQEKAWLEERGVAFEDRDIRANPTYMDELLALGSRATPTTVVDDGGRQTVIVGFNRAKLEETLHLSEAGG
jgi:glutaredoxin-like protein NrdH